MSVSSIGEIGNLDINFFEGAEKLLEIWFSSKDNNETCDLRDIPRVKFESMLKLVNCEIVSFMRNDDIDSYVLSESSMFVSKNRFLLKTCGTTTLLDCIKPLLYLVDEYTEFDQVKDLFYSRKKFIRPELQKLPHSNFDEEVRFMDSLFKKGAAYCLGRLNNDCWYLYHASCNDDPKMCVEPSGFEPEGDQTFEMLMNDLDEGAMEMFTKRACSEAEQATKNSGIDNLIPSMTVDDFLFEPCGYSMNGITKNGYYMTIHVTPEPDFSYVSFETNYPMKSYNDLIEKLIKVFKPNKFLLTVITNKASVANKLGHNEIRGAWKFGHDESSCKRRDLQFCQVKNYDVTYALYSKFPS